VFGRKELATILERLHLNRIARGISKKHRRLLSRLSLKANGWLNPELDVCASEAVRKCLPIVHAQYNAEMRYRHMVPIHNVSGSLRHVHIGHEMHNQLMPPQIEIDPFI